MIGVACTKNDDVIILRVRDNNLWVSPAEAQEIVDGLNGVLSGDKPTTDQQQLFIDRYVASFLASWSARVYGSDVSNWQHVMLHDAPVEDAVTQAEEMWNQLQKHLETRGDY